jgi:hypothetical protein
LGRAAVNVPEWALAALPAELAEEVHGAADLIRHPDEVMTAETFRGMTSSRLSFAQTLVSRMVRERWDIRLAVCDIGADGTGFMAYAIDAAGHELSFGVHVYEPLPLGKPRLFRDTKVEFLGILLRGRVDMDRFRREKDEFDSNLWRGRTDNQVYGWTIAGRGTRVFDDVVDTLARGEQPDVATLDANGGYILRNGGYYGNGRMGTRAWKSYSTGTEPLSLPYHVDLFSVYLWRLVSLDLVEAYARARSSSAVALDPEIRRHVGIGNSSGLGTVAALVRWPARTSGCVLARELAFAYVKSRCAPVDETRRRLLDSMLANAAHAYERAPAADPELLEPRGSVSAALTHARDHLAAVVDAVGEDAQLPWLSLVQAVERDGSREAVEVVQCLLLELYPEVEAFNEILVAGMDRPQSVDPAATVAELRSQIREHFGWALELDLDSPGARQFFWYRSEENGENRRGERPVDLGVERETFLDVAGSVRRLHDFLVGVPSDWSVARFLLEDPEHSLAVARVGLAVTSPYSEIRTSVTDGDFLASDGIRCFLSLLGIELPTPHSGRWVRGLFFRGAPLPEDVAVGRQRTWGIGAASAGTADLTMERPFVFSSAQSEV